MRQKPDWEAIADVAFEIREHVYPISVIELALRNYPDAPKGFAEISAALTKYANEFHEWATTQVPDDAGDEEDDDE